MFMQPFTHRYLPWSSSIRSTTITFLSIVFSLLVFCSFSAVTQASSTTFTPLTQNLTVGSTGSQVISLQTALVALGYLDRENVSGYFGPLTEAAVQRFQCAKGIVCSGTPATTGYGSVGPTTRTAINAAMTGLSTTYPTTSNTSLPPFPTIPSPLPTNTTELAKILTELQNYITALTKILSGTGSTPIAMCSYAPPPSGCTYVKGPDYNPETECGMILDCPLAPPIVSVPGCVKAGCSGQLCVESKNADIATTCEWKSEYACYSSARCERQTNGQCGWTQTDTLTQCLLEQGTSSM